jgi:hypothetical protein
MAEQIEIAEAADGGGLGLAAATDDFGFTEAAAGFGNMTSDIHLCLKMNLTEMDIERCTSGGRLPMPLLVIIQILYAMVCILGLCGNTLVIYVVLRYSKMQTVTYIYILMLAVADEIFLIGIPFLIVTSIQGDWIFGLAMCKAYFTTTSINQVKFDMLPLTSNCRT